LRPALMITAADADASPEIYRESKLQRFAMDARRTPQRVLLAHPSNEFAQLMANSWAPIFRGPCDQLALLNALDNHSLSELKERAWLIAFR
jgi:hypothetical protein